jgi:hypothetical protein
MHLKKYIFCRFAIPNFIEIGQVIWTLLFADTLTCIVLEFFFFFKTHLKMTLHGCFGVVFPSFNHFKLF